MSKLFKNLKKFNNKIALIGLDEKKYSYKEILKKVEYIDSKIENESLIVMIANNDVASIIGYISFIRSNNVTILLDKSFKIEYIQKIISKYEPNYLFGPPEYFGKLIKINAVLSLRNYKLFKTNYKNHKKIKKKNLLLLSTSGTTQNPKFVRLSNSNLENNTRSIIKYLKINSNHNTITTMPMGYSYGLSIINTHLSSGSKVVLNNKTVFDRSFWNLVHKYKITSFGGVPQLYELLKQLKFEKINLPHLKYLTQAGGKLDKTFLKYFESICKEKNIKFIVMYGQTEASPRISYLEWKKFTSKFGSIGKVLSGSKFKILDKRGKYNKSAYSVGELIYFGKNVSLGYASGLEDLYKGDINKGKLFTGDLVYKDNDNYLYIVGRKNRISKIFGLRINLDDIEKQLQKKQYEVKCVPDNKYLKILIKNDYNHEKMEQTIQDLYGINKNFILISKVKQFTNLNSLKDMITLN